MAKKISDNEVKVEAGDTLSGIALTYLGSASKYPQLAAINNISNPNLIYMGQVIKLSGSSSAKTTSSSAGNVVMITAYGIQADTTNNLFATWTWWGTDTEGYEYVFQYTTGDKDNSGNAIWFNGNSSIVSIAEANYSIPDNAELVRFRVKPVAKTYQDANGNTCSHWQGDWTSWLQYDTSNNPPSVPSAPSVNLDKLKLTAELDNVSADNLNATHIEFQVVKDNKSVLSTVTDAINTTSNYVSHSWTVANGSSYKVRCRAVKGNRKSDWSDYSGAVSTIPARPSSAPTCVSKTNSKDGTISVYLSWTAVNTAKSYDIEYATNKNYFDGTDQTQTISGIEFTHYETYGLESGREYFFRIRAVNDAGYSDWSDISSVILGEAPSAPTTWASTATATVGGPLTLYWVHNAKDGSSQTWAQIRMEIYVNKVLKEVIEKEIKNSTNVEDKDKTSFYAVDTSTFDDGVELHWLVRTAGVTNVLGEWSIARIITIHAQPTVSLEVIDGSNTINTTFETIGAFPITISTTTTPAKIQHPIGFHLTIKSNDIYDTVDSVGNNKMVNAGEEIYSKHFDTTTDLRDVVLSAGDVDLQNGVSYTMTCVASMNSGLTAEASLIFNVAWEEVSYVPNASIAYDPALFVTNIRPYCEIYNYIYYKVNKSATGRYTTDYEEIQITSGKLLEGVFTTGIPKEQVYQGITPTTIHEDGSVSGGEEVYYVMDTETTLIDDVLLSVYRREFDGSYTELATGIDNTKNTFITDPHPALDYARYRIVATTKSTGAVSYYDAPGYPVGEKAVIIQWNEDWSSFDVTNDDPLSQPPWSGSLLRLPYNIDVSDSYDNDVSLVKYIGRKRPVAYYGTQLGESSTWNVEIESDDEETLYGLRRLAIWAGDVYVREPSGTGYWANVSVSFSQKHMELTIPVTLTIKRVEGGA